MATAIATTMFKMMESLPEPLQERALEHMRQYIEELCDDARWNEAFSQTSDKLESLARQVRVDVAEGRCNQMDMKSFLVNRRKCTEAIYRTPQSGARRTTCQLS